MSGQYIQLRSVGILMPFYWKASCIESVQVYPYTIMTASITINNLST